MLDLVIIFFYEIFESVPPEKRSYDDLMWLSVAKYFIDNGRYGKIVGKYNYSSMLGIPNLYTGSYQNEFIEQREDYKQQEAKYYVYADPEKTHYILCHLCPTRRIESFFINSLRY